MLVLLGIGFLGGLITALSPCIVPVLPVIVAGGATARGPGSRWRPYAIVVGLVVSFTACTLAGGALLSVLHLPQDVLRDAGIVVLVLLGIGLLVPPVGNLLERPFTRLAPSRPPTGSGGGLLLGTALGLVFVPCAGPVLAAISVVAATHRVGLTTVLLTLAYALGAAVPLLALTLVVRRTTRGWSVLRSHMPTVRRVAGAVVVLTAMAIFWNWTSPLTAVPGYTSALEDHIEGSAAASAQLQQLTGEHHRFQSTSAAGALPVLGRAPAFAGIVQWLQTPGDRPLTMTALRGHVVLVDFWTYSCINCQRELPHVEAWYRAYRRDGLVVVGVHTPEFPFEHVVSNVRAAVQREGLSFPVAIDNHDATWDAYGNEYWPAEYLIDQDGRVRYTDAGEGAYGATEQAIRTLLRAGGATRLPPVTEVANRTPSRQLTPESYLGYERFNPRSYVGSSQAHDRRTTYPLATTVPPNDVAIGGPWIAHRWEVTAAGAGAVLELRYQANDVYLVLGGTGRVDVSVNGRPRRSVAVSGPPDLYTLVHSSRYGTGLLRLMLSPGVQAYDFTFG